MEEGNLNIPITRLINCVSKGVVELYGQDLVDKVKSDAKQTQKDARNNEQVYANLLGADKYQQMQQQIDRRKR